MPKSKRFRLTLKCALLVCIIGLPLLQRPLCADESPSRHVDPPPSSAFWEGIATDSSSRYMQLVKTGMGLIETTPRAALEHLQQARLLNPGKPEAIFGLGLLAQNEHRYEDCRVLFEKVNQHSPTFQWPGRKQLFYQDFGMCLRRSGHNPKAVQMLKRVLDSQDKPDPIVYKELGDAYMAMELLDLAIQSYEHPKRRGVPLWIFSYAMALDRNGDRARAAKARVLATGWDPQLTRLSSSERFFFPEEDRDYALGLGYLQKGLHQRSMFHFERYISQSSSKLYKRQAKRHVDNQSGRPLTLSVKGDNTWPKERWLQERTKLEAPFQTCLKDTPSWLSEISLTRRNKHMPEKISDPAPGVALVPLPPFKTLIDEQTQPQSFVSCLTKVAETFTFPPIKGRFLRVTFVVSKVPQRP